MHKKFLNPKNLDFGRKTIFYASLLAILTPIISITIMNQNLFLINASFNLFEVSLLKIFCKIGLLVVICVLTLVL